MKSGFPNIPALDFTFKTLKSDFSFSILSTKAYELKGMTIESLSLKFTGSTKYIFEVLPNTYSVESVRQSAVIMGLSVDRNS